MRSTVIAAYTLITAALLVLSIQHAGIFAYALDDPYIHLALAENLPLHYGINTSEVTVASSSILYPWLLIPFAHSPLALYGPFILAFIGSALSFLLLARLGQQTNLLANTPAYLRLLAVLGFGLIINLYGLVFTGMEHSLHVAATLAILSGLIDALEDRKIRPWVWAAVILAPFLRYEGLALSLLALPFFAWRGERLTAALLSILIIAAGFTAYGFYLHSLGLPLLPSSILLKSPVMDTLMEGNKLTAFLEAATANFASNMVKNMGLLLLALNLALFALALYPHQPLARRLLAGIVCLSGFAHLAFGQIGWFERYHIYSLALTLLTLLYLSSDGIHRLCRRYSAAPLLIVALLAFCAPRAFNATKATPDATAQIAKQHGTIARFVKDYWRAPVAAGDVGFLAWQNPYEVADVWGLTSEEGRRLFTKGWTPETLAGYFKRHDVELVIVDERFFTKEQAKDLLKIAGLEIKPHIHAGDRPKFYLTNPAKAELLRKELREFEKTLPEGVKLTIY